MTRPWWLPALGWWAAYSWGVAWGVGLYAHDWSEGAIRFVLHWAFYGLLWVAVWLWRRIPFRVSVTRVRP